MKCSLDLLSFPTSAPVELPQLDPLCPGLPVEELDQVVAGGAAHYQHAARAAHRGHGAAVLNLERARNDTDLICLKKLRRIASLSNSSLLNTCLMSLIGPVD